MADADHVSMVAARQISPQTSSETEIIRRVAAMTGAIASSGRIFSVNVVGGEITLMDTMVAAHIYLNLLQEQFDSVRQMVHSFKARQKQDSFGYVDMTDRELADARFWEIAHRNADRLARLSLSSLDLRFVFVLGAEFQ